MPDETEQPQQSQRLPLTLTQIIASVLAAVSASVAASYFGVAGTVIGAGLGSVISVVGGAVYHQSIERTRDRLRRAALDTAVGQRFDGATGAWSDKLKPKQLAFAASLLFVVAVGSITAFEVVSGKPISATVGGSHAASGTTLFGSTTHHAGASTSAPAPAPSVTTAPTPQGTATHASDRPTTTVTVTQTPTASATATPTDTGSNGSSAPATSSAAPSQAPATGPAASTTSSAP